MDRPVLLFADNDVDAMQGLLNIYLEPGSVRLDPRLPVTGQLRVSVFGGPAEPETPVPTLALHQMDVGPDIEMSAVERLDAYTVCIGRFGRNDVVIDGQPVTSEHLISSPGQHIQSHFSASSSLLFRMDRQAVGDAIRARIGDAPGSDLQFASELRADRPGVAAWIQLLASFKNSAMTGLLDRSPLASHHFQKMLVHSLLDIQPHTHTGEIERDRGRLRNAHLRKAMEFCEQKAADPLTVTDIAAAAKTGVRTLQRSFQNEFQMPPMEYVRRIRLDRVRADLLDVRRGHSTDTITDIALRWGFTHLGRFSRSYRDRFGENPSATTRGK